MTQTWYCKLWTTDDSARTTATYLEKWRLHSRRLYSFMSIKVQNTIVHHWIIWWPELVVCISAGLWSFPSVKSEWLVNNFPAYVTSSIWQTFIFQISLTVTTVHLMANMKNKHLLRTSISFQGRINQFPV